MKKIDKLILQSFIGPFILTFLVVVFILLTQHMIKYFDDIVGKDLGWDVLGTLLFYFGVFMTPIAIPLAVLLSSLITFGNLGEHFELTAIKASGISLLRALLPIFIFVIFLTVFAFYSNNNFVPRAALEAYSLLYDIKQKKPSMDLKEGAFYSGIPDFSIKVEEKHEDGQTLEDIIIYDHSQQNGNKEVTIADSGRMYTVLNDRYLKFELYNGNTYIEGENEIKGGVGAKQEFTQSKFQKSQIVLDLSSFQLDRTDKDLFSSNRNMRNIAQLRMDVDSMNHEITEYKLNNFRLSRIAFNYMFRDEVLEMPQYLKEYNEEKIKINEPIIGYKADSVRVVTPDVIKEKRLLDSVKAVTNSVRRDSTTSSSKSKIATPNPSGPKRNIAGNSREISNKESNKNNSGKAKTLDRYSPPRTVRKDYKKMPPQVQQAVDSIRSGQPNEQNYNTALNNVRQIRSRVEGNSSRVEHAQVEKNVYEIQWHKILSNSFACVIMFLIGAPLGAIIKKGGLGVPVLVSILFFIIFYVLNMTGEKYAKQNLVEPWLGIWSANLILLPIGLFFLRQARVDARLFDSDFYNVMADRFNRWILRRRKKSVTSS